MEPLLPANRVKGPSCSGVLPPKGAFREPAVLPQLIRGCKWQEGSEAKEGSCCAKCSGIPWLSKMGNGCGVAADLQPPARNVSAEEGRRMLREKVRIRAPRVERSRWAVHPSLHVSSPYCLPHLLLHLGNPLSPASGSSCLPAWLSRTKAEARAIDSKQSKQRDMSLSLQPDTPRPVRGFNKLSHLVPKSVRD